jgi:hypothetical protein
VNLAALFCYPAAEASLPLIRQSLSRRGSSKRSWFCGVRGDDSLTDSGKWPLTVPQACVLTGGCKYLWLSHFCGRGSSLNVYGAFSEGDIVDIQKNVIDRPVAAFYHSDDPFWCAKARAMQTHRKPDSSAKCFCR